MSVNGPYVSVLMPALNEEASIAGAIRSVLEQRDVDIEVLVINGRSTDRTADVVRSLAASDPRIRLLSNPRSVIPSALNIGLNAARGTYVARVDCHATVTPDYLARGAGRLEADPGLAGVGGLRRGVSSSATGRAVALALSSRFGVGNSINHYATEYQETDHASFGVYRADAARAVGGWDESLLVNEDVDFDLRLLGLGYRLGFDPEMIINWQVRETAGALFRQYRRYGRGKAAMVRKNGPKAVRARHLAAPGMVGAAAVVAVATPFRPVVSLAALPYAVALAAASYRALQRRTLLDAVPAGAATDCGTNSATDSATGAASDPATVDLPTLPAAFAAMHFGWGLGFLEGVALGKRPALASGSSSLGDEDDEPGPAGDERSTVDDVTSAHREREFAS